MGESIQSTIGKAIFRTGVYTYIKSQLWSSQSAFMVSKTENEIIWAMPCENMFSSICRQTLLKHAYSYILKILPAKNENFQIKFLIVFQISAQNIDCWYSLEPPLRGSSNEYPQSMFLSRNKKNNVYPCKPQFFYIKVAFKGFNII